MVYIRGNREYQNLYESYTTLGIFTRPSISFSQKNNQINSTLGVAHIDRC